MRNRPFRSFQAAARPLSPPVWPPVRWFWRRSARSCSSPWPAAAACALETKAIEQDIETARTEGNDLEVAQSMLSNPSRIKHKAESLGMAAPSAEYTDHIVLPEDIVIVDAAGKLSLSQSIAAAAAQE